MARPAARDTAPKPAPKGSYKLLFYRSGYHTLIDADGKNEKQVSEDRSKLHPGEARLSPDGKRLAALLSDIERATAADEPASPNLYVREFGAKEPGTDLGVECQTFCWSAEGMEIAYSDFVDASGAEGFRHARHRQREDEGANRAPVAGGPHHHGLVPGREVLPHDPAGALRRTSGGRGST